MRAIPLYSGALDQKHEVDLAKEVWISGPVMGRKQRYIARLDEVAIAREGETAIIQYLEEGLPGTHLKIGPELAQVTDAEILVLYNESLRAQSELAARHKHVAVEVPLNSPQISYFAQGDQWTISAFVLQARRATLRSVSSSAGCAMPFENAWRKPRPWPIWGGSMRFYNFCRSTPLRYG